MYILLRSLFDFNKILKLYSSDYELLTLSYRETLEG